MEKKWLKIDGHVHSSGVSLCSGVSCEEIIDFKKSLGYDGVVLTNHCQKHYYPEEEHAQYIESVIEEFLRGKEYADKVGFRWYLGLEVSLFLPHYADWLLYGVTEEFLRSTPCLYNLSQEEMYTLCHQAGVLLVQAHPYRQRPCDARYMDGVELNCKAGDLGRVTQVEAFAKEHDLIVTCGTDLHGLNQKYRGGILLPEDCYTAVDMANYMRKGSVTVFRQRKQKTYECHRIVEK